MFKRLSFFLFFLSVGIFLVPALTFAKTTTADLGVSASSSYTYDNTKIEFSGGVARLKTDSTWLNSSWGWRQAITVTNPTIFNNTSTEIQIDLTNSNSDFWNHIESNGRSLRFTSNDGSTLLNHYVESFDYSGQTSTVYVSVPSISRQTTTTIYMYFGNTAATDLSSATNTFYFDETFTGASIDTSKYTIIDANNVFSQNGTQLVGAAYEGGSSWHSLYASTTLYTVSPSSGLVFEADFTTTNVANKDQNLLIGFKNNSVESVSTFFSSMKYDVYINGGYSAGCSNYSIRYNSDGTNTTDSGYDIACDTTYRVRIVVYPSNGADYFIRGGAFTSWTYLGHSTLNYSDPMVFAIIKQEGQATIDNVRIRHSTITATSESRSFPRYAGPLSSAANFSEPAVIYENGMFKMWYSTTATPFSIGYATSSDGINWSGGSIVLSSSGVNGTFDKSVASRPEVIKDTGIYYLYYNGFETDQSGVGKIGLATSSDGINWNRYSGNPILATSTGSDWESNSLYNSAVVKVGSVWYMLYEGRGATTNRLGLATSSDGITWTKYASNPVITNGLAGYAANYAAAPNLIYQNGKFYTWFLYNQGDGTYRMARAYSSDAINWTRYNVPELSPEEAWEYISVSDPSAPLEVNGSVYMYYMGGNQNGIGNMALLKYNGTLSSLVSSSTPFLFSSTTVPFQEFSASSGSTSTQYSTTHPTLVGPGVAYDKVTAFNATSTGLGSVNFQISNNGSSWYYWNDTAWASASNSSQSNSSTVINTNITTFSDAYPSGTFYWKAFFVSDGTQSSSLSNLSFVTNLLPTVTVDTISGTKKSSVTFNYNLIDPDQDITNLSQTVTSGVEYSLNGTTWSDATASTTGDGLTGLSSTSSPGQAHTFVWDSTTDASTTESNTVYMRFRPNDGSDFATSWTTSSVFSLDNVAPSGVGAPTFGTISTTSIEVVKPATVTDGGTLTYWQVRRDSSTLGSIIATSTTSTTVTGLSSNTQYTFDARFSDLASNTSTFSATSALYTAANIPTLLSATVSVGSGAQIALSWTGDATDYYVENTTANTNSGWQISNEKIFSNLTCNTTYVFRVKGRNGDQVDTSWSSNVSATTLQCGNVVLPSFSPVMPINSLAVTLNNQQTVVTSSAVTLLASVQNAKQIAVSNYPNFADASWEEYSAIKDWKLLPGSGQKIVYVKFRSAEGAVSDVYKLNLTLNETVNKSAPIVTNTTTSKEIVKNDNNLNLKIKNSNQYTAGSLLQLSYQYTNETKTTVKIRVMREVVNNQNKVIKRAYGRATLKPGKSFTNNTKERLPTNLKVGDYFVRVRVYEQGSGIVIGKDDQSIKIIKRTKVKVSKKL
jgi:predicted GH43/DUF377 family glycosyl hydrolase